MIDYINGLKACADELLQQKRIMEDISRLLKIAYENGSMIYLLGNGGSASTASHFARDLKIGARGRYKCLTECLTDNIATVTSLANDISYEQIFAEQLEGQVTEDDLVIAISCSGNSVNILNGLSVAKRAGAKIIGIIGFGGGKMRAMCDKWIVFQNKDYGQCEDIHNTVCHLLTNLLKERLIDE